METFNLFTSETDLGPTAEIPPGYQSRAATLGPKLGASRLGMSVYDVPSGQMFAPYHFEWTDEEWLIVIAGRPTLRTPEGERVLEPGDVVCFPAGPDGAHQVRNGGEEPIRVAIFSTKNEFGISEYPDSDKVGVWAARRTTCSAARSISSTGTASVSRRRRRPPMKLSSTALAT